MKTNLFASVLVVALTAFGASRGDAQSRRDASDATPAASQPTSSPTAARTATFRAENDALLFHAFALPWDLVVSPTFQWQDGFPYSTLEGPYGIGGARFQADLFPNVGTIDIALLKDFQLPNGYHARVGVQVFNLTDHSNPEYFRSGQASPHFGPFANSPTRQVVSKFVLLF